LGDVGEEGGGDGAGGVLAEWECGVGVVWGTLVDEVTGGEDDFGGVVVVEVMDE
jgi:hypothetical protein